MWYTSQSIYTNIGNNIHTFYKNINEAKLDFSMLPCYIQQNLISTYCINVYGTQL